MPGIKVSLLGKFKIVHGEKEVILIRARKVQELFTYLLVFRNHPQPREGLAEILWPDQPPAKSRKNLRQTLWHLQTVLKQMKSSAKFEMQIDEDWIQLSLPPEIQLDIAELEYLFDRVHDKNVRDLGEGDFRAMQSTVNLYEGDLLEGWYMDWCIFERERFQMMHLTLLGKLVQYCEIHQLYEIGLAYGWQILRFDHAYERAHRQVMRLYFMSGNRTQALHQYERCVTALRDELSVEPSERTKQLYEQIRQDKFRPSFFVREKLLSTPAEIVPAFRDILARLEHFALTLRTIEIQIQQEIVALESALPRQG
jgi:DNA-binding SARP family transcriptional activator